MRVDVLFNVILFYFIFWILFYFFIFLAFERNPLFQFLIHMEI